MMGVAAAPLGVEVEVGDSTTAVLPWVLVVTPSVVLEAPECEADPLPDWLAEAVATTPLVTVVVGLPLAEAEAEAEPEPTTDEAPLAMELPTLPAPPVAVEMTLPTAEVASETMELASWPLTAAARARTVTAENCILKLVCLGG